MDQGCKNKVFKWSQHVRIISYIVLILIILLGVSFAILNSETVNINYYVGQKVMPLSVLLAAVFSGGCLLGIGVGVWLYLKAKVKNYRLRQRLKMADKEIENLRAIPLQDKH
jgi:lipopolysaccharide assembly protein A